MAILITTHVKGQTADGYDNVSGFLHDLIKTAPGFILHTAYGKDGEWFVLEVWQSKADADAFFAQHVVGNLPRNIIPKRSYQDLHAVVAA